MSFLRARARNVKFDVCARIALAHFHFELSGVNTHFRSQSSKMFSANMLKQRATLCAVMTLALSVASSALGAVAPDISGALQQQQQQQQTQASQVTTQKLPNVNIYISKNEVKKMLGKFYCC